MMPTATKARPIIFDGESVRAILGGRQTQTRRLLRKFARYAHWGHAQKILPDFASEFPGADDDSWVLQKSAGPIKDLEFQPVKCHLGNLGDELWVRERWAEVVADDCQSFIHYDADEEVRSVGFDFDACCELLGETVTDDNYICEHALTIGHPWTASSRMPRWASRLTLRVTNVRVERLQEISNDDAWCEGVSNSPEYDCVAYFRERWDQINGKRAPWETNPWVWVVEFERVRDVKGRP